MHRLLFVLITLVACATSNPQADSHREAATANMADPQARLQEHVAELEAEADGSR